jgi:hypothetical protein
MFHINTTGTGDDRAQAVSDVNEIAEKLVVAACVEDVLRSVQTSPLNEDAVIRACDCEGWLVIALLRLLEDNGFICRDNDGGYRLSTHRQASAG